MSFELSVTILNVGHGNSAVVRDGELTHIIDTGGAQVGLRLLDYLNAHGVTSIQTLILSHGDEDHIGSASTLLLSDVHVEQVFVNSDSTKRTKSHAWLMNALRDARRKKATRLIPALTLSQGPDLVTQAVNLEVLFPPPESVVSGPGGLCYNGTKQSTNSLSGVIRISGSGSTKVLLPADCGMEALSFWADEQIDSTAAVVVFPHHGGRPGSHEISTFTKSFVSATAPSLIVFSLHSSKFDLPRDDVINAIVASSPATKLICTQLPKKLESKCADHPWNHHSSPNGLIHKLHVKIDLQTGSISTIQDV